MGHAPTPFPPQNAVPPLLTGRLSHAPGLAWTISLPIQNYRPLKVAPIPFDPRVSHGARFLTLRDAMNFIAKHSLFHHQQFNKALVRLYLPLCRVLDFVRGGYFSPAHISKKEFDATFTEVFRALQFSAPPNV
jgi:hypothetical protein